MTMAIAGKSERQQQHHNKKKTEDKHRLAAYISQDSIELLRKVKASNELPNLGVSIDTILIESRKAWKANGTLSAEVRQLRRDLANAHKGMKTYNNKEVLTLGGFRASQPKSFMQRVLGLFK